MAKLPRCFLVIATPLQDTLTVPGKRCAQQLTDIFTDAICKAHVERRALKILTVHVEPIQTSIPTAADPVPVRTSFIAATPKPLARARLQAINMQNELASILESAVLIDNEWKPRKTLLPVMRRSICLLSAICVGNTGCAPVYGVPANVSFKWLGYVPYVRGYVDTWYTPDMFTQIHGESDRLNLRRGAYSKVLVTRGRIY